MSDIINMDDYLKSKNETKLEVVDEFDQGIIELHNAATNFADELDMNLADVDLQAAFDSMNGVSDNKLVERYNFLQEEDFEKTSSNLKEFASTFGDEAIPEVSTDDLLAGQQRLRMMLENTTER